VIWNHDNAKAEESLLKLTGLRRFIDRLKSKREKEDFKKHLRKYVNIWSSDCPFEVSTTNRYTITTQEAAVFARREIDKGETIKYLCGNLVAMTPAEEKDLDLTRRDFSIVMSSRKKTPSLFLGPARFSNHDCNANARLVTTGSDGMQVVALRKIARNEEITVTYGEDYFGIDNCECLCHTCELAIRNGWEPTLSEESRHSTPALEENNGPYSFRRKRKHGPSGLSSGVATPNSEEHSPKKRRVSLSSDFTAVTMRTAQTPHQVKVKVEDEHNSMPKGKTATEPILQHSPEPLALKAEDELKASLGSSARPGINDGSYLSPAPEDSSASTPQLNTFATPNLASSMAITTSQTSQETSDAESVFDSIDLIRMASTPSSTPSSRRFELKQSEEPVLDMPQIEVDGTESISSLSSLSSGEELDDARQRIVRKPRQTRTRTRLAPPAPFPRRTASMTPSSLSTPTTASNLPPAALDANGVPMHRVPGDYTRTPLLLSEPCSRWIDCHTCDATWVQAHAYQTRRECPRCERHSKLYGVPWPKTEPGKGKERIRDHREVDRFLDPKEEKEEKRRGRGVRKSQFGIEA
jgi:histone-lysine N-methyltransferase SUV420H